MTRRTAYLLVVLGVVIVWRVIHVKSVLVYRAMPPYGQQNWIEPLRSAVPARSRIYEL